MLKILRAVLFWTLVLCACAPSIPSSVDFPPEAPTIASTFTLITATSEPPTAVVTSESPTLGLPPTLVATISTPHIDQGPDGAITVTPIPNSQDCGYQWAQQDLPELSSSFQQSIQTLQPGAQAKAFAFGENCMHEDGTATFIPMETDFNITFHVNNVNDESDWGNLTVKVMQIIDSIPPDQIVGPKPGRVTIVLRSGDNERNVNFYIDQYHKLPPNLTPLEIITRLKSP